MRKCADCATDISTRHALAYLCDACVVIRRRARKLTYYKSLPASIRLGRHDQPDRAPERRKVAA